MEDKVGFGEFDGKDGGEFSVTELTYISLGEKHPMEDSNPEGQREESEDTHTIESGNEALQGEIVVVLIESLRSEQPVDQNKCMEQRCGEDTVIQVRESEERARREERL